MTLRISSEKQKAELDCPFCHEAKEYGFPARLISRSESFPTPETLLTEHFVLGEEESEGFGGCDATPVLPTTAEWELVDADADVVIVRGELSFSPTSTAPEIARAATSAASSG